MYLTSLFSELQNPLMFGFGAQGKIEYADDKHTVHIPLPGFKKEDIKIDVQSNILSVSATPAKDDKWAYEFLKRYRLPDTIDVDKINAQMKNGILEIELPILESKKPKSVSVKIK